MNASDVFLTRRGRRNWVARDSQIDALPLVRYKLKTQACARCTWCLRVVVDRPSALTGAKRVACDNSCRAALLALTTRGVPQPNNPKSKGKTWKCKGPPTAGAFKKGQWAGEKHARWKPRVSVTCKWCGDKILKAPYNVRPGKDYYCVQKGCYTAYRRSVVGAAHHSYRGGHDEYRGARWPEQRLAAVIRDRRTCQRCHKFVGDKIDVHHIIPYRFCKQHKEANELENLTSLCNKCHKLVEWQTWRFFEDLELFGMKRKTPRKQKPPRRREAKTASQN